MKAKQKQFLGWLNKQGLSYASSMARIRMLDTLQEITGKSIDAIVISDILMQAAFKTIKNKFNSRNSISKFNNALRYYYEFVNGKKYPVNNEY